MADVMYRIGSMTVTLEQLRSALHDETLRVILENIVKALDGYTANAICPTHREPPHITISFSSAGQVQVATNHCCDAFAQRATSPYQKATDRIQTAHFRPDMKLIVAIQGGRDLKVFDANQISRLMIGRAEPGADDLPDINLHEYGAVELGVSRKHASIIWWEGALHLVDNTSANGTYIDEKRLEPQKPQMLHDGDLVRIGKMVLGIKLVNMVGPDASSRVE